MSWPKVPEVLKLCKTRRCVCLFHLHLKRPCCLCLHLTNGTPTSWVRRLGVVNLSSLFPLLAYNSQGNSSPTRKSTLMTPSPLSTQWYGSLEKVGEACSFHLGPLFPSMFLIQLNITGRTELPTLQKTRQAFKLEQGLPSTCGQLLKLHQQLWAYPADLGASITMHHTTNSGSLDRKPSLPFWWPYSMSPCSTAQ